ncbi:RNA polymerase II subunit A C-terminal domain phosphatase, partial [Dissostichus eleginoides]
MEDPPADSDQGPVVQVAEIRWPLTALPLRLLEWKVKPGTLVNVDSVLALCVPISQDKGAETARLPEKKVKADRAGVVKELCCQLGQVIPPGGVIIRIEECSHPIVMKGLCAECGQDLTQLQSTNGKQHIPISTATVSMVHSVPELMVSSEQAEQLGREDQQRLHRNRKLVLMVDLDQTLIHTTEQHCQRMSNKGILHFQLGRGEPMLHTRLRPHCKAFLEKIAKLYELHVFTFGSRLYAHTIAGFLDPEKKLFSHRILSRDECIDPFSKTGNLRNLFPCGDSMVSIIDDREDVWKFAPNLITVKKYIYFQGTGDINAPPGSREAQLAKKGRLRTNFPVVYATPRQEVRQVDRRRAQKGLLVPKNRITDPRKRRKDQSISAKEESTTPQEVPTNERTHPKEVVEDESGKVKGSETDAESRETQVSDRTNVKEDDSNRTLVTKELKESSNSSVPTHESNNLDFDLSSDSDNDSVTNKPSTPESESEGKTNKKSGQEEVKKDHGEGAKEVESNSKSEGETGSESAEPSGVLPPDPELGNGCPDKREPETESQNSEQSGDDHLIYLEEVLERIHGEYYTRYEAYLKKEGSETPDMRKIAPELKSKTLEGTTIVFSGLYPTNYPMERTREHYHAKALGAKIGKHLVLNAQDPNRTTHLIAARAGTEKVRQAQECKHLHVVNPDWLWSCLERWERVEETLSNSPAAFPDIQGSLQKHIFQPAPILLRSQSAAPEVQTYDPVTGKLIRRGPQGPKTPSYLQGSGPFSDHRDPSSLRGASSSQQDGAEGSNRDDEQPGPSRRKRQPSMSETMPLYTLCKEDLESMDRE